MPIPTLHVGPSGFNVRYRVGNPVPIDLEWPAGLLAGRTFDATLDDVDLALDVVGDTMTVTLTDEQSATMPSSAEWVLTETTDVDSPRAIMVGRWIQDPLAAPSPTGNTVQVIEGTATVNVSVGGSGGGGAVDSVNGQTGVVVLDAGDVGAEPAGAVATHAVLTGIGTHVPTGGTETQVLTRVGAAAAWADAAGGADLGALGDSMLAFKVWDADLAEYVWSGGVAPTDGFTNIEFVGPVEPDDLNGGTGSPFDVWIPT